MWVGYEVMVRYHSAVHGVQWSLDKVTTAFICYMCLYYRVSVTFDAAPTCLSQMCVLHMSHCMLTCLHKCTELAPVQISQRSPTPPSLCLYSQCVSSVHKPTRKTKVKKMCFAQNPQSMANVSHVPSKRAAALLAVPPSTTIAPSSCPTMVGRSCIKIWMCESVIANTATNTNYNTDLSPIRSCCCCWIKKSLATNTSPALTQEDPTLQVQPVCNTITK